MKKVKNILVRIDEDTKEKATLKAKSLGLCFATYVRVLILQDLKDEKSGQ